MSVRRAIPRHSFNQIEDEQVIVHVMVHGERDWTVLGAEMGLSSRKVRERYHHFLKNHPLKEGQRARPWTDAEDQYLLRFGEVNRWKEVSANLRRGTYQCLSRYRSFITNLGREVARKRHPMVSLDSIPMPQVQLNPDEPLPAPPAPTFFSLDDDLPPLPEFKDFEQDDPLGMFK
jgi:hypothetical protein